MRKWKMPTVSLTHCCSTPALIPGERGVLAGRMQYIETGARIQTCWTLGPSAIAVSSQTGAACSRLSRSRLSPSHGYRGDAAAGSLLRRGSRLPMPLQPPGTRVWRCEIFVASGFAARCHFLRWQLGRPGRARSPSPAAAPPAALRNYIYPGSVVKQLPLGRAVSVFPHAALSSSHECQSVKPRAVRRKKHLKLQKHKVDFTPEQHQAFWSPRCCNS